jgi:hypothetical protein
MIRIPAPYLRGFAVLTIGATFLISHTAFAAPQISTAAKAPVQMAAVSGQDGEESLQDLHGLELAENCYLEVQKHRTRQGKVESRIVHECD